MLEWPISTSSLFQEDYVLSYLEFSERMHKAYLILNPLGVIDRDIDLLRAWEAFTAHPERYSVIDHNNPTGDPCVGLLLSKGDWHLSHSHSPTLLNRPLHLHSGRSAELLGSLQDSGYLFWTLRVTNNGSAVEYPLEETSNRRNAAFLLNRAVRWRTGLDWLLPTTPQDIMDPDGSLPLVENGHSVHFESIYAPRVSVVRQFRSDQQWAWGLYVDDKHHPLPITSKTEVDVVVPSVTSLIGPVSFFSYSLMTDDGAVLHESKEYPESRWVTVAHREHHNELEQLHVR